ncbi:Uu.00g019330.m01.CDS01 [Anthostomella pinea]|uniref:Uu.00g019330.m01.CDS01 n=1 Tax=Anthostomella pinea TaxID=933095 RepID=A0AAI8VZX0_9PEZI|nr:Uu.00g019330.m01.CDS01 [Anthostomella pinea]
MDGSMDPSSMDFVMHPHHHHSHNSSASSSGSPSRCPAMRAAQEQQQQNQHPPMASPNRETSHYDPVYGNVPNRTWFQQPIPSPQPPQWRHHMLSQQPGFVPESFQPSPARAPGRTNPTNPTNPTNQLPYPIMNQHDMLTPVPHFYYRPAGAVPTPSRLGSTAPAQHSAGGYLGPGQAQGSAHNPQRHSQRTGGGGYPTTNSMSSSTAPRTAQPSSSVSNENVRPDQQSDASRRHYLQQSSMGLLPSYLGPESSIQGGPGGRGQGQGQDEGEGEGSRTAASQSPAESAQSTSRDAVERTARTSGQDDMRRPATNARRYLPRMPTSSSDWSSDDDPDSPFPEPGAVSFYQATSLGSQGEDPARVQQLLRGSVSGKRVASKKAIASLQSVDVSDLPESERTCIICYNDFGVANPEGVNEAPLKLPKCKHVFGDHCIKKWFEESDSCPYCRDKVPSEPQYRHATSQHDVYNFVRHQQIQFRALQTQSRDRESRDTNSSEQGTNTGLNAVSASITASQLGELGYNSRAFATASSRLMSSAYGTRSAAYATTGERRSPPNEFNENRRRTRPRHGSARGSPPSGRPSSFGSSPATGLSQTPYPWLGRQAPNQSHRDSPNASGSPTSPAYDLSATFPFQPHTGGPSDPYINPLNMRGLNTADDYAAPLSPTMGGPDTYMANSDHAAYNHTTSHQQS